MGGAVCGGAELDEHEEGAEAVLVQHRQGRLPAQHTVATVDLFKKHGFTPVYKESAGGHTWLNWRDYLNEFAPQLFR